MQTNNCEKHDESVIKIIHDLKTPINAQTIALESFLQTAENKISQDEKDLIELTLNSCNYMQKLIDIFTSVDKLKTQKIILYYEKFDIKELIVSSINELKILLKYYKLNLDFNYEESFNVNADKLQIKRVIENLLSNSINYAFKNSTIKINLFVKNRFFVFEIQNKSPYIEPKNLKDIFKKYKTLSSTYNKNSVGLGLYLSQEIIKAHQGKMIAKSKVDNTNVFGFAIPIN